MDTRKERVIFIVIHNERKQIEACVTGDRHPECMVELEPGLKACPGTEGRGDKFGIALFGKKGLPIIRFYHAEKEKDQYQGTDGFEFHPSIEKADRDAQVIRTLPMLSHKTELASILIWRMSIVVILCGLERTCLCQPLISVHWTTTSTHSF